MLKFRLFIFIFLIALGAEALALAPTVCRKELDDTYNTSDEDSLNISLQNLGLCLEIELYPNDVKDFLNRESICIHIAGEEPYSGSRAVELDRLNNLNKCEETIEEKQRLLKKYEKDTVVTRALKSYGNKIYPGNITIDAPPQNTTSPGSGPAVPAPDSMIENSPGGVI